MALAEHPSQRCEGCFRKPWPRKLLDALGTATDAELAKRFGCRPRNVFDLRKRMGIPPFTTRFVWTKEKERLLGTRPDAELARLWKCHDSTVNKHRLRLKIPNYQPPEPDRPWMKLLGKVGDTELARRFGVPMDRVRYDRNRRGIPACPKGFVWTRKMDKLLGQIADATVARKLRMDKSTVRDRRVLLGIDAYETQHHCERFSRERLALLGKRSDRALARQWGIHFRTIGLKRRSLGIAPCPRRTQTGKRRGRPKSAAMARLRSQGLPGQMPTTSHAEEKICHEIVETFGFSENTLAALRAFRRDHAAQLECRES